MLTIWPIRGRETVPGWWDLVKSKSDSHNPEEEASVLRGLGFFSDEKRRCALDSILVNLNKTICCGSGLCLCRPATVRWSDFQPSHWSIGPCEGLSLAADDRGANCDRRWSNYLISIPLQLSLSSPSLCTVWHIIISSYLCFRGNFLTLAWYHQPGSVAQICWDCEKRSLSSEPPEHFILTI